MTRIRFAVATLVGFLLCTSPMLVNSAEKFQQMHCNVFWVNFCFAVGSGDRLSMEIPVDYVLYQVTLAGRGKATIYVGQQPDKSEFDEKAALQCDWPSGFEYCKLLDDGKRVEMHASRSDRFVKVHLIVEGSMADPQIDSFVQGIRACRRSGSGLACGP